jgi:hypothetical protein
MAEWKSVSDCDPVINKKYLVAGSICLVNRDKRFMGIFYYDGAGVWFGEDTVVGYSEVTHFQDINADYPA